MFTDWNESGVGGGLIPEPSADITLGGYDLHPLKRVSKAELGRLGGLIRVGRPWPTGRWAGSLKN